MSDVLPPVLPDESADYNSRMTTWLDAALYEGEALMEQEAGYRQINDYIHYVSKNCTPDRKVPRDVANYRVNRTAKAVAENVAALTDIKPIGAFQTFNDNYEHQADLLNRLQKAWWLNNDIDIKVGDIVQWSCTTGLGYGRPSFIKARAGGLGDIDLEALDPRDVIPIRPTKRSTIQDWQGTIYRIPTTVNYARQAYPKKAALIQAERDGSFASQRLTRVWGLAKSLAGRLQSSSSTADMNLPMVDIFIINYKDRRNNETGAAVGMGTKDTNWYYEVAPGMPLYPWGRLIVMTRTTTLWDGPNPYWHGCFDLARLQLDPQIGSMVGRSIVEDLIPLNDLLNELVSKTAQACRKALAPGIIADKNAVSDSVFRAINTELPNMRLKTNPVMGEGIKLTDPPQVPQYVWEMIQFAVEQIDDISGTRGLAEVLSLKQVPGFDTLEKIQQAMTPLVRRRARIIESFVREISNQTKFLMFQFYNQQRRIQILGQAGMDIADFDREPGTLIPSRDDTTAGNYRYRAYDHVNNFHFHIEPGSMLNLTKMASKMIALQVRRMGDLDHTSFLEKLEFDKIPEINERLSSELDQKIAAAAQAQEGRPPTAQAPPQMAVKGDGRPIVRESR